ncbi:MAG: type IX secretion system protein PorQ [Muribaculum sp.]|nr:type IX secretion system protein PorQ [Muribaculum sp.]
MSELEKYIIHFAITTLVIIAGSCVHISSQESAYSFLNIPTSTLRYGLGGINISAIEDDISSIDQNPGLLGPEIGMQLGLNYMRYIGESDFTGIKFGKSAGEHSAWAAGVQYFGYGEIQGADINGIPTHDFFPKDIMFTGTYAHDISQCWRGGISLKFIYSNYDSYSAMALATDIGVNYFDSEKDFSFSTVIANLGGQIKRFHERYNQLPVDVRIGASKRFGTLPVIWSLTTWNLTEWGKQDSNPLHHIVIGADLIPSEKFHIGMGYNHKTRSEMSTYRRNILSGFSLCAGLNVKNFGVGVAMAQPHTGATTIMLNLSTNLYEFQ